MKYRKEFYIFRLVGNLCNILSCLFTPEITDTEQTPEICNLPLNSGNLREKSYIDKANIFFYSSFVHLEISIINQYAV